MSDEASDALCLLGFEGDHEAALREAFARAASVAKQLFAFEGVHTMVGEKAPTLLVVARVAGDASASTLDALERALALDEAPSVRAAFGALRVFGHYEGQPIRGLLVGMTDCASRERREEFDRWYDEHHAIDVARSGMYILAERFIRCAGDAPEFLALYPTSGDEPETFERYLASPARDRTRSDAALVRNVWAFRCLYALPEVTTWN